MMTFIEEYHKEIDQIVLIPELDMDQYRTLEDFMIGERGNIARAISISLELMIKFGVETMPCFVIKDTEVIFNTDRSVSSYSVDQCIEYFIEIEDYEKCAKLINLKSKL